MNDLAAATLMRRLIAGLLLGGMLALGYAVLHLALTALVPFGTPFVWGAVGIWLLLNGQMAAGIGLVLWGRWR